MRWRLLLVASIAFFLAPVSYVALLTWYWPLIDPLFGFMLIIAKAQFWTLVIFSPIILATKLYELLKRFT